MLVSEMCMTRLLRSLVYLEPQKGVLAENVAEILYLRHRSALKRMIVALNLAAILRQVRHFIADPHELSFISIFWLYISRCMCKLCSVLMQGNPKRQLAKRFLSDDPP